MQVAPNGKVIYNGMWSDSKRHGGGILMLSNGTKYIREWVNGKQQGGGVYTWSDRSKYIGQWYEGKRYGCGMQLDPNGKVVYNGNGKDDMKHSEGASTLPDGKQYSGGFEYGKQQGKGTFTWPDGSKYVGQWHDNKRQHGYGIQTDSKSKVIYNGILVDDTQGGYHHLAGRLQFDVNDSKLDVAEAHPQENEAAALAKALNCAQCGRNPSPMDRPVPICGRCDRVSYYGRKCEWAAWKEHKKVRKLEKGYSGS